jgi:hypothetical protein
MAFTDLAASNLSRKPFVMCMLVAPPRPSRERSHDSERASDKLHPHGHMLASHSHIPILRLPCVSQFGFPGRNLDYTLR